MTVAARMMCAFGRDGLTTSRLGTVSPTTGVPARALAVEMIVSLVLLSAFRLEGTAALDVFFYLATLGVLSLLAMYILTNIAAAWRVERSSKFEAVLPLAGTAIAGYVLYRNVWPVPPAPYRYFPYGVLAWLTFGLVLTMVVPGFVARVGRGLAEHTGEAETIAS